MDIEKGAVDIAQLRFWLALVVDETEPQPLPNLDYKIMQGNSLLESFEGIDLSETALFEEPNVTIVNPTLFKEPEADYGFSKENRADIKQLINVYFKVEDKEEKTKIHKTIDKIVLDHIDKSLEFYENKLLIEIATYEQKLESKTSGLNAQQKEQVIARSKEIREIEKRKKQLGNKAQARIKLLEFENTDERPYFLWHLFFMDVFEQGGFDIMIGNPPYIQLQKDKGYLADLYKDKGFKTFTRSGDIYMLFYEKGNSLLKENGMLSYITSNSWMKAKYGKPLRKYFIEETNPIKILNFEDTQIFPSATVEVNIIVCRNQQYSFETESVSFYKNSGGSHLHSFMENNKVLISDLDESEWLIIPKEDYYIKTQILKDKKTVEELDYYIVRGFTTGANEAFYIDKEKKDEIINADENSKKIIKPILKGRNLKRWKYKFESNYCLVIRKGFNLNEFSSIKAHLSNHYEKLNSKSGSAPWYELQANPSDEIISAFDKPKIVWGELSDEAKFAYDDSGYFLDATVFLMLGKNLKTVLSIMNSKLGNWYFSLISSTSGMGTNRWKKYKIEKFPLPNITNEINTKFKSIADYLILINDPEQPYLFENISNEIVSRFFEEVLNMMVYELYFEEHMKESKIDVLQFVDFKDISQLETFEEKRDVIQREYYKLKEKDNPIRNRILLAPVHSPNIIKRINKSTH